MTAENQVAVQGDSLNELTKWANSLAKSALVPKHFQGNPANCFIAIDFARHMRLPVLAVMRGTYVVHGSLGFSAEFTVARINASGKFDEPLTYEEEGSIAKGDYRVRCTAPIKGKVFKGPWVSLEMAKAEGWTKNAKYQTMPDVMLGNRAATFFGRRCAPETLFGVQTVEELEDMAASGQLAPRNVQHESAAAALNAELEPDTREVETDDYSDLTDEEADEQAARDAWARGEGGAA